MSQLVLIAGIKDGTADNKLINYIKSVFPNNNEVWMDPNKKPRAVILFDKKRELKDIQKQLEGTELGRYFEAAKPTHSILVETYESFKFGVKDKLKYLFTSRRHDGSPVLKVEQLNTENNDCYEIVFTNWDAVLKACKQTWRVEEQTLSVTPYFECFKEPFETQRQRLIELNNTSRQVETVSINYVPQKKPVSSSSDVSKAPLKSMSPQPFCPGFNAETTQNSAAQVTEKQISVIKDSNQPVENKTDLKWAKSILEHEYILMLLHLLNFEKAVQTSFVRTTVIIDESFKEIEITGPVSSVVTIQKLLTKEDELDQAEAVVNFLANKTVQQELKTFVDSQELHVDIITAQDKPYFEVNDGKDRKVSFHDFISSLVISRECSHLPSEQSQENIDWISLIKSFESRHQHIFVKDKRVILTSLAHLSGEIDLIMNIINNVIIKLKTDVPSGLKSDSSLAKSTVSMDEDLTSINSNQSSEGTESLQTKRASRPKKKTIFSHNSTLLWILNFLNIRNAIKQIDSNLEVDISEQEIIIEGPQKEVKNLASVITTENMQFSLSEPEQELLSNTCAQEHLKACLTESGCCIVSNKNLEMFVAYNQGEKEQLRTFLTELIQIRECLHLPKKYHNAKEWVSLVADVKNSQPCLCVFTANDKVYVLSVAVGKSLDVDSFVKKVNETITNLTSTEAPEQMVGASSSSLLKDQKMSLDHHKFEDEAKLSSSLVHGAVEKKKKKMYIKHPVLVWILKILHLKEAVSKIGVHVTYGTENEVILKGSEDIVQGLQKILLIQENEMSFEDHHEEFLSDTKVQHFVESCLYHSEAHIVLSDNMDLYIEMSGEKMPLKNFFTNVIQFKRCSNMPEMYQSTNEWEALVQKYKHFCHIIVTKEEVYLLILASDGESNHADIVQEINKTISNRTSSMSQDSEMTDDFERHDTTFECPKMKKLYFQKFLENDIQNIVSLYEETYESRIEPMDQGFRIYSTSPEVLAKMADKLMKSLSEIKHETKIFPFPFLQEYLNSTGSQLLEDLSDEYKCLFDISPPNSVNPQNMSFSENISSSSVGPRYKVTILGTAKCNGLNIHLVHGNMQDLNLKMRIKLKACEEVDVCDLKSVKSNTTLVLLLPRWLVTNETTQLENLRSSFKEQVSLVLDQAKHIKQTSIAFSTDKLSYGTKYPFPADVIARGIIEKLFEHFHSSPNSPIETVTRNIYICDQRNEAVFNAFIFFLKLRNEYFGPPDQASWDNICFQESTKCPNYRTLQSKVVIELLSYFPSYKSYFFYPIHPCLDIKTCPALSDPSFPDFKLKSFLSEQQIKYPDGLLTNEILPFKDFQCDRITFIYSSPDWGMYSAKTIEWILQECMEKLSKYEEVYIVPPGMQQPNKYPEAYLAQTLFKQLDNLLLSHKFHLPQKRKLTFIVQNYTYKKAFDQELQKRLPKNTDKGMLSKAWDYLVHSEKRNEKQKVPQTVRFEVPETIIRLWGTSELKIQNAAMQLEKQLKKLMEENTKMVELNEEETSNFTRRMEDMQAISVMISYTKQYKTKAERKNKKKGRNGAHKADVQQSKPDGSLLKIQGLSKIYVNNCLERLGLATKVKDEEKLKEENAQSNTRKSAESLGKSSHVCKENSRQKDQDKLLDSKDISTDVPSHSSVQMTCFKWLSEPKNDGETFQEIPKTVCEEIEIAYFKGSKDSLNLADGKFSRVNFTTMTALEKDDEKGIIRTEVLETPKAKEITPHVWTSMKIKNFKLEKLEKEEYFQGLQLELKTCIENYSLHLLEVSRVQNKPLYNRFNQKSIRMKDEGCTMWHIALDNCKNWICRNGFHPRFSGMPEAKHLGDGVLFYKTPDECLNQTINAEKEIHLFSSRVLLGRSGPGKPGLRRPPSDENGELFDSVHYDTAYMIFSDAQAYPDYVLTLQKQ